MKPLTILVDMDDTIEDLIGAWVSTLNARHGTSVTAEDITAWEIQQFFPSLTQQQVFAPLFEDEFWKSVRPIPGAAESLRRLIADGHTVRITTNSHYKTLRTKMDCVLFRYFPFIQWSDVIITSHKQLVAGDVLVDDGVHNLVGGPYAKVLMDAPHNRSYDAGANGMTRVHGWQEAYAVISAIAGG